jgi:hypothetical protein
MRRSIARATMVAALIVGMGAPTLAREHGRFRSPPGFHHGLKAGWGRGHTPPGWHRGRKIGWDRGHVPPGLRRR